MCVASGQGPPPQSRWAPCQQNLLVSILPPTFRGKTREVRAPLACFCPGWPGCCWPQSSHLFCLYVGLFPVVLLVTHPLTLFKQSLINIVRHLCRRSVPLGVANGACFSWAGGSPPLFFLSMVKSHPVPEKHRKKQRSTYVCDISSCVCNQEIALFVLFLLHGFKNCVAVGKMIALLFNSWSV